MRTTGRKERETAARSGRWSPRAMPMAPQGRIVRVALHVHRNGLSHTWDMAPT